MRVEYVVMAKAPPPLPIGSLLDNDWVQYAVCGTPEEARKKASNVNEHGVTISGYHKFKILKRTIISEEIDDNDI